MADLAEIIKTGLAEIQEVFNIAAEKSTGAAKPLFERMRDAKAAENAATTQEQLAAARKESIAAFDALYQLSFEDKDAAKEKEAFLKAHDKAQTKFYKNMAAW